MATIHGRIPYNSESHDLGGFVEVLRPGCIDASLALGDDVVARVEHDSRLLLGRTSSGTLRITSDSDGFGYSCELPDTVVGRDTYELCRRGDIVGTSFAFYVEKPEDEDWIVRADGTLVRYILRMRLKDCSPCSEQAYPAARVSTKAAIRSEETEAEAAVRMQRNRLRMRLLAS